MKLIVLLFSAFLAVKGDTQFDIPDHFFHVDPDDVTHVTDETSGPIPLTTTFHLFDKDTDTINVNENGVVSFPLPMLESVPNDPRYHNIPVSKPPLYGSFIAPFWTDNMPIYHGKVMYKEYTQSNAPAIIDDAKRLINDNFHCIDFEPTSVFVATWYQVYTRYECVLENSIEYCDCLISDQHRGDVEFCTCRNDHSNEFCTRCPEYLRGRYHHEPYCKCLDETDNYDLCYCKHKYGDECSCLVEHDIHYCDCLVESQSEEHAWNCSCSEKHPDDYCDCLRVNEGNEGFCSCVQYWQGRCDCYLSRSKEFCDCYKSDGGSEGFCDCIESGKDVTYCECVNFVYQCMYDDVYIAENICQCFIDVTDMNFSEDAWDYTIYCECVATRGANQCEDSGISRRSTYTPCYELDMANNLIRSEGSTYQAALISDGTFSFVVLNFGYWSKYMAEKYPRSRNDAEDTRYWRESYYMGMKSDDASSFRENPTRIHSLNIPDIWCTLQLSNNGVPGQLIYRTDQYYIQKPDCVDITVTREYIPF